ncbi:DNA-formamidopyrimidine glycosylase family protein [Aquipuribacter hungaricus]|uniref:DNA-formamidopyrimidine glycosylase family protein n=1 Tax=Aquipuribacter hungaricus TaxID=545624 RepID=A0ABV7WL73_9MICO
MPELPEVEALVQFLAGRAVGRVVARVDVLALNVLKTFDPPPTALQGLSVVGVSRHGKVVDLDVDGLHLLVHFSRAGWAQWRDPAPTTMARPGKGPLALRVLLDDGEGMAALDLTEAGTQKRLAVHVVHDPMTVPYVAALGSDPLALDARGWGEALAGTRQRLKTVLTDQKVVAGIGNAYSDDIMHAARISPFAPAGGLDEDRLERLADATALVLGGAVQQAVGLPPEALKDGKRTRMRVHGRTGQPCEVCGTAVAEVSYTDTSFQYCPTCQTGGQVLADRRLSRLLK